MIIHIDKLDGLLIIITVCVCVLMAKLKICDIDIVWSFSLLWRMDGKKENYIAFMKLYYLHIIRFCVSVKFRLEIT